MNGSVDVIQEVGIIIIKLEIEIVIFEIVFGMKWSIDEETKDSKK